MEPTDEELARQPYTSIFRPWPSKPVIIPQDNGYGCTAFSQGPFWSILIFPNSDSDARDHCANERTFLSWLRLSVYMAVVSVAIVISFHLKSQPSKLERRIAVPFGLVFWLLSLACLGAGVANYIRTINRFSQRRALVQSGWKTQTVFSFVGISIVATCILLLVTKSTR